MPETGIPAYFYTREEPCAPDSLVACDPGAFWLEAGVNLIGAGVDLKVVCPDGETFLAADLSVKAAQRLAEQLLDAAQEAATFRVPEIPFPEEVSDDDEESVFGDDESPWS